MLSNYKVLLYVLMYMNKIASSIVHWKSIFKKHILLKKNKQVKRNAVWREYCNFHRKKKNITNTKHKLDNVIKKQYRHKVFIHVQEQLCC